MSSSIDQDIALLVSLMADGFADDADPNFAEILKKLEKADNVAQGVEGRLDNIIENLDTMLASLETTGTGGVSEHASNPQAVVDTNTSGNLCIVKNVED